MRSLQAAGAMSWFGCVVFDIWIARRSEARTARMSGGSEFDFVRDEKKPPSLGG